MNLLNALDYPLSFLDIAYGPSIFVHEVDPATKAIVIGVLVLFLAFVGYLIWKSIRTKDK